MKIAANRRIRRVFAAWFVRNDYINRAKLDYLQREHDHRYQIHHQPCANTVMTYAGFELPCGTWYGGEKLFCERCETKLHGIFPQGWRYYPGDVCQHGVYVGGCGADYMCGRCESG
jgi:hypothetical protein